MSTQNEAIWVKENKWGVSWLQWFQSLTMIKPPHLCPHRKLEVPSGCGHSCDTVQSSAVLICGSKEHAICRQHSSRCCCVLRWTSQEVPQFIQWSVLRMTSGNRGSLLAHGLLSQQRLREWHMDCPTSPEPLWQRATVSGLLYFLDTAEVNSFIWWGGHNHIMEAACKTHM